MPARPAPIKTSGHSFSRGSVAPPFSPLPSEIRTPIHGRFEALKSRDEAMKTPITPPAAYTEFLKNTINSPALSSPRTLPYSPPSSMGSCRTHHGYITPATPYPPPVIGVKKPRTRTPPSPAASVTSSPYSGSTDGSRSGSDDEDDGRRHTVKQVVHTNVTYNSTMNLLPAPKGKRRRLD